MSENFCKEHQTPWFMKGKMKNYAHPIEGTDKWCNKPEEITQQQLEEVKKLPAQKPEVLPEHQEVIEKAKGHDPVVEKRRAMAVSYAKDIAVAKIVHGKETSSSDMLVLAKLFESYMENGIVITKKES